MCAQEMNQSTIDSLFAAADSDEKFAAIDFQNRKSLTSEQMQFLIAANQSFGRSASSRLSAWLDINVKINMVAAERTVFREFLEIVDFGSMYFGEGSFSSSSALVCLDFAFVSTTLNLILGGTPGRSEGTTARNLTAVDSKLTDIFLDTLWGELSQIWAPFNQKSHYEGEVHFANVGKVFAQTEYLLLFTYEMQIGDMSGVLQIALSATVGDTLLRELDRRDTVPARSPETRQILQNRLAATKQKMYLRSPSFSISVSQILNLTPGTILNSAIPQSVNAEFGIRDGKVWKARPSQKNGRIVAYVEE